MIPRGLGRDDAVHRRGQQRQLEAVVARASRRCRRRRGRACAGRARSRCRRIHMRGGPSSRGRSRSPSAILGSLADEKTPRRRGRRTPTGGGCGGGDHGPSHDSSGVCREIDRKPGTVRGSVRPPPGLPCARGPAADRGDGRRRLLDGAGQAAPRRLRAVARAPPAPARLLRRDRERRVADLRARLLPRVRAARLRRRRTSRSSSGGSPTCAPSCSTRTSSTSAAATPRTCLPIWRVHGLDRVLRRGLARGDRAVRDQRGHELLVRRVR